MSQKLSVLILWSPVGPQELHRQPSGHHENARYPCRTSFRPPDRDALLSLIHVPHVHHGIHQEQSGDRIPSPRLDPPRRNDEADVGLYAPCVSGVGYDYHRKVDSVALGIYDIDYPESLRWECGVARLLEKFVVGPEKVEDGIEVDKRIRHIIWRLKGEITGLSFEFINVCCPNGGG